MAQVALRSLLALTLLCAVGATSAAKAGEERIGRGERALVAVVNLSRLATKNRAIYRYEESRAVAKIRRELGREYGRVSIFTGGEAGHDSFLRAIREAELDPAIRAIDAIVYLHGHPGEIGFVDTGFYDVATARDELLSIAAETGGGGKLRALYSDACYGASHVADWLRAGFRVASGSVGVDTNWSRDLSRWMDAWTGGDRFGEGIRRANRVAVTRLTDWIIHGDSRKVVEGDAALGIDSPVDSR
jgi:hypothetical protein